MLGPFPLRILLTYCGPNSNPKWCFCRSGKQRTLNMPSMKKLGIGVAVPFSPPCNGWAIELSIQNAAPYPGRTSSAPNHHVNSKHTLLIPVKQKLFAFLNYQLLLSVVFSPPTVCPPHGHSCSKSAHRCPQPKNLTSLGDFSRLLFSCWASSTILHNYVLPVVLQYVVSFPRAQTTAVFLYAAAFTTPRPAACIQ